MNRPATAVYAIHTDTLENFRAGTVFLRLRVKNNSQVLFTLKTRGINDLDSPVEIEFEVSSKEEFLKMKKKRAGRGGGVYDEYIIQIFFWRANLEANNYQYLT